MKTLIIVLAVLVVPALSFAATYYVPDHFSKIQTAIADPGVVNGDVIIVRDGLYHENLDFLGKEIQVKSENGPVTAIIDGGGAKPVVRFASNEGVGAVIEGFTLTNGWGEIVPSHSNFLCGGGILCLNASSPLIKDNLIVNNVATNLGGGVAAVGDASGKCSPVIQGNTISNNAATNGFGGGIGARYSDMVVQENIIDTNVALVGGGISIEDESDVLIANCALFNNAATNSYGGAVNISYYAFSTEIRNCLIYNNSSLQHGGGIYSYGPPITISNSTFYGNRCITGYGGGIGNNTGGDTTINGTISNNAADRSGGGIENQGTLILGSGHMIEENHADNDDSGGETGGGISTTGTCPSGANYGTGNYRGSGTATIDNCNGNP